MNLLHRNGATFSRAPRSTPLLPRRSFRCIPCAAAASSDPSRGMDRDAAQREVDNLLQEARNAASKAEAQLRDLSNLPSALDDPPDARERLVDSLTSFLRGPFLQLAGVLSILFFSHHYAPFFLHALLSLMAGAALGVKGLSSGSLDRSGALAAAAVGFLTLASSFRAALVLLGFYYSSSALTKYKDEEKAKVDGEHKKGGQRDWRQVVCNAGVPTLLAVLAGGVSQLRDVPLTTLGGDPSATVCTALLGSFLGYYACCCGDTWASELGTLSKQQPRLITTLRPARRGTNGAVTLLGLGASIAGGLFIGMVFYFGTLLGGGGGTGMSTSMSSPPFSSSLASSSLFRSQGWLIPLGLAAGLVGSLLDSVLGATIQFSGYDRSTGKVVSRPGEQVTPIAGWPILSNNAVNIVSATMTGLLTGWVAVRWF